MMIELGWSVHCVVLAAMAMLQWIVIGLFVPWPFSDSSQKCLFQGQQEVGLGIWFLQEHVCCANMRIRSTHAQSWLRDALVLPALGRQR